MSFFIKEEINKKILIQKLLKLLLTSQKLFHKPKRRKNY